MQLTSNNYYYCSNKSEIMFFKFISLFILFTFGQCKLKDNEIKTSSIPCTCGIFLSGQFTKGSKEQPKGNAVLLQELDRPCPNNAAGIRQCTNKCLEAIVKHLPNSPPIICTTSNRDCHKEKAHLFIKNVKDVWINTKLSAGREFCCKDSVPYKCPP